MLVAALFKRCQARRLLDVLRRGAVTFLGEIFPCRRAGIQPTR